MVTVEYLMVGEETYLQIIIGEPFMQGFVHSSKRKRSGMTGICHLEKNIPQPLSLFLTVRKDIQLITLTYIFFQCLLQHFEILMEQRLGRNSEFDNSLRVS